jgi:menaquinone-9 beta-reductase
MEMGLQVVSYRQTVNTERTYDIAIIGGGLAGLSLSIQLARKGLRVCVFEKESYPFHKVCGEYISMESWDFLTGLGLPLEHWNLPRIHQLLITAPDGRSISAELPQGGFGISRFKLDAALAELAKQAGVHLFENSKVHQVSFEEDHHLIQTPGGLYRAKVACACYGKKSNLDVKWKRSFMKQGKGENYVGVKYHVKADLPAGQISLHNFPGGYCGISRVEDGVYCLCYLTSSENLRKNQQSIPAMEEKTLKQNPALKKLLEEVSILYQEPVTIAQISFSKKTQIENHILCIGDAAGMITPLCGNGMSMALHASKIAAGCIQDFFSQLIKRQAMENNYQRIWDRQFSKRLKTGRLIQRFFGHPYWSSVLIRVTKPFPFLVRALIRQTHGGRF